MTQIKLSIALVLAAAAVAPVVAQPIHEGDEFASNVVHLPHHHHHHHGHNHHHQSATPVEHSSLEPTSRHDTIPPLSPREYYAEEFEVRGLFDDSEPETPGTSRASRRRLRFGTGPVGLGQGLLGHRPFPFNGIHHRGPVMLRHGLARHKIGHKIGPREFTESEEMLERDFDDSEPEIATREFDDLFERQESEGAESSPSTSRRPLRFSPGPVRLGHGLPRVHRPFKGLPPRLGLGLLGHRIPHRLHSGFGLGPVNLRQGRSARRAIGPREFTESEEMLERDFEDIEDFDARELDDDLYLD